MAKDSSVVFKLVTRNLFGHEKKEGVTRLMQFLTTRSIILEDRTVYIDLLCIRKQQIVDDSSREGRGLNFTLKQKLLKALPLIGLVYLCVDSSFIRCVLT